MSATDTSKGTIQYRPLGRTGVQVSNLCFGTMSFGAEADEETSAAMYRRCRDVGINFFDCANVYAKGRSEEILGRLVTGHRDEVVLTSKVGFPAGPDANARGLSRRHILLAVETSLKRLNTDRIDLYFLHRFDERTPIEEALRALDDLVRQGKIVYPAISNTASWQIAKALGISARQGWERFECLQPMYNLVKRQAEVEILPMALSEQLGVISYSPLGGGLLTGKYSTSRRPEAGRLRESPVYAARYGQQPEYFAAAERFTQYAADHGFHPAALAVAWVMVHPAITAPIIGARNVAQLDESLGALDVRMSPELRAEVAALTPEPPLATDREEERRGVFPAAPSK
jgi:aryl-alcohol dehydrogenase-like predicted oxidoreductase